MKSVRYQSVCSLLAALCFISGALFAADFPVSPALSAEQQKQFDEETRNPARDPKELLFVGSVFQGFGEPLVALKLFEKVAATDNAEGFYQLGKAYRDGNGVPKNDEQALALFRRGAIAKKGGDVAIKSCKEMVSIQQERMQAEAQIRKADAKIQQAVGNLEKLKWQNRDKALAARNAKNFPEAVRLTEEGILLGDPDAMFIRAGMYQVGEGSPKKEAKAIELWRKAADVGHLPSMVMLGFAYKAGIGVKADLAVARTWFEKAAAAGEPTAKRILTTFPPAAGNKSK
jgi:TPR repeat protein